MCLSYWTLDAALQQLIVAETVLGSGDLGMSWSSGIGIVEQVHPPIRHCAGEKLWPWGGVLRTLSSTRWKSLNFLMTVLALFTAASALPLLRDQ